MQSYQGYTFASALCNVHHLRELTFVEEERKQSWARDMKELLLEMKAEVEQAKTLGQHTLDLPVLAELLRRYEMILGEGYLANPPPPPPKKSEHNKRKPGRVKQNPARNLLDRFSQKKQDVLRFLYDFTVPFDNNQAERDLSMIKACNRSGLRLCWQTVRQDNRSGSAWMPVASLAPKPKPAKIAGSFMCPICRAPANRSAWDGSFRP